MALFRRLRAWWHRGDLSRCVGCGRALTADEKHYYGGTCEACECRAMEGWADH